MLPFARLLEYGNVVDFRPLVGYNFSTIENTGKLVVSPTPVLSTIPIPVSDSTYTNMMRISNNTSTLVPLDNSVIIGVQDFEFKIVFYLYDGNTGYDVISRFMNVQSGNPSNALSVVIGDAGYLNRLQFGIGAIENLNTFCVNVDRSMLSNKVNTVILKRKSGMLTGTWNGQDLLFGIHTNPSTNPTISCPYEIQNRYLSFGETPGGVPFGVDMGIIDYEFRVGDIK